MQILKDQVGVRTIWVDQAPAMELLKFATSCATRPQTSTRAAGRDHSTNNHYAAHNTRTMHCLPQISWKESPVKIAARHFEAHLPCRPCNLNIKTSAIFPGASHHLPPRSLRTLLSDTSDAKKTCCRRRSGSPISLRDGWKKCRREMSE